MFSYQCSFLLLPFHATAFILYQSVSCLSTTFLNYFLLLFLNLSNSNSDILSYIFLLVNNFFEVFSKVIFKQNGERGIRTLAPVARPTPLAGAPLRPLEYFSSPHRHCSEHLLLYRYCNLLSTTFLNFSIFFCCVFI